MAATLVTLALDLCNKIADAHDKSSLLFNGQQCMVAYNKLLETQGTLELLQRELPPDEETSSPDHVRQATQELVQVLTRAYETFFKDCFCTEWMETALRQHGDVKETVGELLYDLQWCRSVLCSILLKRAGQDSQALKPEDCDGTLSVTDRYALSTAAKKDQENLKTLLRDLKVNHTCSGECWNGKQVSVPCLATQLLEKFDFQEQPKVAQEEYYNGLPAHDRHTLSKWPLALLISPEDRSQGPFLASGSFGDVFRTAWRGETYAMKIPKPEGLNIFKQEIAALAGMHHPHIMRLVCCTEGPAARECSYLMELMDMTLFNMLEEHQILCLLQAVDLILQVAEGMKYLHSMGLVHRDLKPHNILVKKVQQVSFPHRQDPTRMPTSLPLLNPVWIAKVSDFGTSKAKNESTAYSHQTLPIGSTLYMAPEVYDLEPDDEEPERFHPMKTDVYSFGILCFVMVTGKSSPFEFEELVPTKKFKDNVRQGKRPTLPPDCPARLSWLITRCWHGDPLSRPSFPDICRELRYIKGLLLTDDKSTLVKIPRSEEFQVFQGLQGLQFSLQPHEFLTQVEGYEGITHYHHGTHERVRGVSGITFHTNLKTYGPYGGGKEPNFAHFQSSVGRIVGFCGSSGSIVDSIGVFVSHDL
ncbi:hypothetical protein CY35_18G028700 [Sphagnum magellanicum]|nr:hypothetical protein CY35_18G028700 [Sphagnum magellanicum]